MAALTQSVDRLTRDRNGFSGVGEDAVVFYGGGLVGVDLADGLVKKWADTATYRLLGLVQQEVTGDTSATPPAEVIVNNTGPVLKQLSVTGVTAQTEMGELVYATSDNDYTLTPTANVNAVGRVDRFISSGVADVKLFTDMEYLGL